MVLSRLLREDRVPLIPLPILHVRAALARAYVRVIGVNRDLASLVLDIFLPIFSVAAFALLYRSLNAPSQYLGYVILGGAMTAFWLNVLWGMSSQWYFEKRTGNLPLYLIAPMSRLALLAGMALGGLFSTTLRAMATAVVGCLLFGVTVEVQSIGSVTAVFVVTMVALYGLGMMTSSLFLLWGREAWHLSHLLQEPVYLLAGFNFPVRCLGSVVATIAGLVPITLGLDATRQLLFARPQDGFLPVGVSLALLAVQSIVYVWAACHLLEYMERVSRREGTLTLRHQ